MGSFIYEIGTLTIPSKRLKDFLQDVKIVADQGGFFSLYQPFLMGRHVMLLSSPTFNPDEKYADYNYSYFEKTWWENAGVDLNDGNVYSGKIGWKQFYSTAQAIYVLAELYSTTLFISGHDSELINEPEYTIKWLRYILNRRLKYHWRYYLWDAYEVYEKDHAPNYISNKYVISFLKAYRGDEINFYDYFALLILRHNIDELINNKELLKELSDTDSEECKQSIEYFYKLIKAVEEYKKTSDMAEQEQVDTLLKLITASSDERRKLKKDIKLKTINHYRWKLTPPIFVRVLTEIYKLDFWNTWFSIRDDISVPIHKNGPRKKEAEDIIIKTNNFFNTSSADRLYWCLKCGDVTIDDSTIDWISSLIDRYKSLLNPDKTYDSSVEQRKFINYLADNEIKIFESLFFDFMANLHKPEYNSALSLLQALEDETEQSRYLSLLANKQLRKIVFGF